MSVVTKESNPELYNALFEEDEIKKILEKIKSDSNFDDYVDYVGTEFKPLLDYINNLQEENERLKELCDKYEEEHSNEFQCWKRDRKELLDKRTRNEKAKEFIEHENFKRTLLGFSENKYLKNIQKELLNILGGDDNE